MPSLAERLAADAEKVTNAHNASDTNKTNAKINADKKQVYKDRTDDLTVDAMFAQQGRTKGGIYRRKTRKSRRKTKKTRKTRRIRKRR